MDEIREEKALDFSDLLKGLDKAEVAAEFKLAEVSAGLCALLAHAAVSRVELARRLGWTPSRVTKVLSGEDNLTLRTISKIVEVLDFSFDLSFRRKGSARSKQPWERSSIHLMLDVSRAARDRQATRKGNVREGYQFTSLVNRGQVVANDDRVTGHATGSY